MSTDLFSGKKVTQKGSPGKSNPDKNNPEKIYQQKHKEKATRKIRIPEKNSTDLFS